MEEYGVMKGNGIQLHGIIVTHPDGDHLNGIKKLLEKYGREILSKCDIVITKAFYWRSRDKLCKQFTKLIDNAYTTRNDIEVATCLRPGLNCHFPTETGCLFRCAPRDNKVKYIHPSESFLKEQPEGIDDNKTSILTIVNESTRKCDVVLTGDSNAKEILPFVEGKEIRIFQVPHHGSSANSKLEDSRKIEEYSRHYNLSAIQDKEFKEVFLFYSTFRAQCYLISSGGMYDHPRSAVLQGIILANSLRRQECVILVTNSRGLDSEKLKQLHELAPQWTRYVKIYHYDDVFFTEQCHTMLRPERCISDVRANAVEWTPEEYINRTRIMLPVKPIVSTTRPLKNKCFIEKSTAEITVQGTLKFNAHVICVPLPHNPRSGDSINCCYVIEESIACGVNLSKALFLLNGDTTLPLSRAKKYILVQYSNNEWQKKQLPATLKDISSQTTTCNIPHDVLNSLWPVQDSSPQTSPRRIPHYIINSRQPIPDSSPHSSPSHTRQPHHGISSLQHGGEGAQATASATNYCAGVQQQRGKAEQQNIVRPSSARHHPQYNDDRQLKVSWDSPEKVKTVENQLVRVSPTKGCGCRTGCDTKRCGCKKRESYCGASCQCGSECKNNHQYAFHLPDEGQLKVAPDKMKMVEVKVGSATKGCGCKTGCATRKCGCKKQGLHCGPSCKCINTYFNCEN